MYKTIILEAKTLMYAEVIINSNAKDLNRIFDYIVPINIEETIRN